MVGGIEVRTAMTPCMLAASVLLQAAAAAAAAPSPADLLTRRLDNGLEVTILSDDSLSLVGTRVWYHVGAANEAPGARGFAHLFEHLMFGDTRTVPRETYARLHSEHGGYDNAYTSWDETVYISTLAPAYLDRVLELEADRMVNLVLSQENLDNEKRIVAEELRLRQQNDPFSRVAVRALEAVLGGHPYAITPAGTAEDIAAADLARARRFYARYYRPRNAHLIIVGPVDPATTMAEVRATFGRIPAGGETPVEPPPLLGSPLPRSVVELEEDLPPVEVAIAAWPLPAPADSSEHWALVVLQQLLGGGAVDPMDEALVRRRHKAVFATTQWFTMRRGGALVAAAAYLPYRRQATAFRYFDETVDALASLDWLTDDALAAAKRTVVRRRMTDAFDASAMAEHLGRAQWWLGDAAVALEVPARIDAVTRAQVAEVFRRYVADAEPARLYIRPEHVPLWVTLFGWLYPVVR